jgi:hypothetical protein
MIYEKSQSQSNNYVSVNALIQNPKNYPTARDQENQTSIQRKESEGNNSNHSITEAESINFFTSRLQNEACHILDINRAELNKMEKRYQSDLSLMNGPAGRNVAPPVDKEGLSALNQAIQLDINLADTQDRLKSRLDYLRLNIDNIRINVGWIDDPGKDFEKLPVVQKYRDYRITEQITSRLLEVAGSKRGELRKTFPAMNVLTVPDFDEFKTAKPGINGVSQRVFEGIERAKKYQDIARTKVLNGDMPLYKLDILVTKVKQQFKNEGLWKEPFSGHVDNWIKSQERFEWVVNIGGTLVGIGLAIGAFFTGGMTAILLGIAGGAAGAGVAGYDFEMAGDVVDAARSGKGGKEQLVNERAAELNYLFATVNLALSVINFALTVKKATELIELVNANKAALGIGTGEEVLESSVEGTSTTTKKLETTKSILQGVDKTRTNISVDIRKFSEYIFKDGAAPGKNVIFKNLGYKLNDSQLLAEIYKEQAIFKYTKGEYTLGKIDVFGQRINIEIELNGIRDATGKTSHIKSGWMIRPDGSLTLNTPFSGFIE